MRVITSYPTNIHTVKELIIPMESKHLIEIWRPMGRPAELLMYARGNDRRVVLASTGETVKEFAVSYGR